MLLVLGRAAAAADLDRSQPVPLSDAMRQRCVSILRAGLASDEFWPAMHAAEAMSLAGHGRDVIAALRDRLPNELDHQRRCGLARELVRAGDRSALPTLFATLADEKSNGRVHAAESLYKIAEIDDGRLLRSAFAQRTDSRLRLMAAAALGRCGHRDALSALRESLASDDREVRKIAAWVLGLLGEVRDLPALLELHRREHDGLARTYAANALACLGHALGRVEIGRNLASPDAAVRTFSAEFAGYARCVEQHAALVKLLDDAALDVRVRAAQSLIAMSQPPSALGLPIAVAADDISVDVWPATPENPRYSEGSIVVRQDGALLLAVTEFVGAGADHATASIVARESSDGGRTWAPRRVLQPNIGKQNVMSVTLRRLPRSTGATGGFFTGVEDRKAKAALADKPPAAPTLSPPDDASPLGLFFLIKNSPTDLKVCLRSSHDDGKTFGDPLVVSDVPGYHVMNNDRVTVLSSGRLVCPVSSCDDVTKPGGPGEAGHFSASCFLSDDGGRAWRRGTGRVDQPKRGAMEPEVIELADGKLLMIVRTQLGHIATSVSADGGDRWSEPSRLPLPAPEAPATIRRVPATGDAVLIWNNTHQPGTGHGGKRTPLTAAVSSDEGRTWSHDRNLESRTDQTFAYTSVLFHKDRVLLSYYVGDDKSGRISTRFRSLPVRWLYATP